MIRVGYAAQNLSIPETTNRTLRLANLGDAEKVRALVSANITGLIRILKWNSTHGVGLFRMGQQLIPFASHGDFPYDWRSVHGEELRTAGRVARDPGIRLSMHPGQYIQPGSPNPVVVANSLAELRYCTALFDLFEVPDMVMVLHLGGSYGEPDVTADRFVDVMSREPAICRYLALENDERIWSVRQVVAAAERLHVPAIVDTLHHELHPDDMDFADAFAIARATWTAVGRKQKVHISSQDPAKQRGAHAFGIDGDDWNRLRAVIGDLDTDVMVESKGKEKTLIELGLTTQPTAVTH